jgi:hypothetical protein
MIGLFPGKHCLYQYVDSAWILFQLNRRILTRFIEQPIGTGFSYGADPFTSTVTAALFV